MVHLKKAAMAAASLLLSTGIAAAIPANVATDLNMRAGPGTEFGVIMVLPDGASDSGWCQVRYVGQSGFASAAYLDIGAPPLPVVVAPSRYYDHGYVPGLVIGPSIHISIGGDRRYWRYRHPGWGHRW